MIDLTFKFDDMKKEIGNVCEEFFDLTSGEKLSEEYSCKISDFLNNEKQDSLLNECVKNALDNAVKHGNKSNFELPINIYAARGEFGSTLQIIDSGEGFNYVRQAIQTKNKMHEGRGFTYFELNSINSVISYEGTGNIFNLMYKFSKNK